MADDPRQYLNDGEEALRLAMEGNQAGLWTAMPAVVIAVNTSKMTLDALPAIQGRQLMSDGSVQFVNMPPVLDVPIIWPGSKAFCITFPIVPSDEVLVIFASRCIDAWWQSGGVANKPMEFRMHDLSDGFAIPGPRSLPNVISGISATDLQVRNGLGTTYVSIGADTSITLNSPSMIQINAPSVKINGIDFSTHLHPGVSPGASDTGPPL